MRMVRALGVLLVVATACSSEGSSSGADPYQRLVTASRAGAWRAEGDDRIEVWVCRVPSDTTAAVYGTPPLPLRYDFTPDQLVAAITPRVTTYFTTISHGRYRPVFVAGGDITMGRGDEPADCAAAALDRTAADTRAVLLVADAEHAGNQPGGFGSGGVSDAGTAAKQSRRWAYVGASDFSADWGDNPPMDLIEHELGHTIGWVHSGTDINPPLRYTSALDVMSDSAAPRDVDATRRDGPDTIAVQRVASGWLHDAASVTRTATTVQLDPSTGDTGLRMLVVPLDDRSFLTVELLTADGYDDHLPVAGLAVHRVTIGGDDLPATIDPLNTGTKHTALLEPGGSLTTDGWVITAGDSGSVDLRRAVG